MTEPNRLSFVGASDGVTFYGNVVFGTYNQALVDVIRGTARVRYLLQLAQSAALGVQGQALPTEGIAPLTVAFSAVVTGEIAEYACDFEGDGAFDYLGEAPEALEHTYVDPGQYSVAMRVTGKDGSTASDTVVVTVHSPNRAPAVVAVPGTYSIPEGESLAFTVSATDPDGDSVTMVAEGMPPNAEFSASHGVNPSGVFKFQPDFSQQGLYVVTFTATDPAGFFGRQEVSIEVLDTNWAPEISILQSDLSVAEGGQLTVDVSAVDGDGGTVTLAAGHACRNASFQTVPGNPASGQFQLAPDYEQAGTCEVTITATDPGEARATATFAIVITATNRAPAITSQPPLTTQDLHPYSYPIVAVDPDGDTLTYRLTSAPVGMSVEASTGHVRWTPASTQIGEHAVTVRVEDGQGRGDEQSFVVSVQDRTAPAVRLLAPSEVPPAASLVVEAQCSDNVRIDRVSFSVDGIHVQDIEAAPFRLTYNAPSTPGQKLEVQVVAWDTTGNQSTANATVTVVAAPDESSPVIHALALPPTASPNERVTVRVDVSDPGGVAGVRFLHAGEAFAVLESPPYEAQFTVPLDTSAGDQLEVFVEAEDMAGNLASASGTIEVVLEVDTEPPFAVSVSAPSTGLPGQKIQLGASAQDAVGVMKVVFLADGVVHAEDTAAPYEATYAIAADAAPGASLVFQARAVDFSGNQTESEPVLTTVVAPGDGFLVGEVYDDATGLPLEGAAVRVVAARGRALTEPLETHTDGRGRYQFPLPEGAAAVECSRDGYTRGVRDASVLPQAVTEALDIRLTPIRTPIVLNHLTGGSVNADQSQVSLYVPPGAFSVDPVVSVTPLGGQGLPAPLPLGWTPLGVVHVHTGDADPAAPLELTLGGAKNLGAVPGKALAVVWDSLGHRWVRLEAVLTEVDVALRLMLPGAVTVATVVPDALPAAPPTPAVGEPLTGVSPFPIAEGASADILPSPKVLFLQPGARSAVRAVLKSAASLSSGTRIEVDFEESYDRTDGSFTSPEPMTQDVLLYQRGTGFEGVFVASPSENFDPALLREGVITLTAHRPAGGDGTGILGPAGGTVTSPDGITLSIPAGALAGATPVGLRALSAQEFTLGDDPRFQFLTGAEISLGGQALASSASLSLALSTAIGPDEQVLVVRPIQVQNVTRYELVALGAVEGSSVLLDAGAMGLPWPGITEEGRYFFVGMLEPVGFLSGTVTADGPSQVVSASSMPFVRVTFPHSTEYVLASMLGPVTVSGFDTSDGATNEESALLQTKGEVLKLDLILVPSSLAVISTTPEGGAVGVSRAATIRVNFSDAIDSNTLNETNFRLTVQGEAVTGSISLLTGGRQAVFRPTTLLQDQRRYQLILTNEIQDRYGRYLVGNQDDGSFAVSFETEDLSPPRPPDGGQIAISEPVDGIATISGTQGSVELGLIVVVRNTTTGVASAVTAESDGSFSVSLEVELTDSVELTLRDAAGNETLVDLGRAPPPTGYAVLTQEGGVVEGEGGISALIPAGTFPAETVVSITPIDLTHLPQPFGAGAEGYLGGAVQFSMEDVEIEDVTEIKFSIDGYGRYTVVDRVPLFEVDRTITLPDDLPIGTTLLLRVRAVNRLGQSTELEAQLEIVEQNPDLTPHTIRIETNPALELTLPAEAVPGQSVPIFAKAAPPDIKIRFPAGDDLTGEEQFILYDVRELNGDIYYLLQDTASLVTLPDGRKVIETNSPPYRGIRKSTENLAIAIYHRLTLGFARVGMEVAQLATSGGIVGATTAAVALVDELDSLITDATIASWMFDYYSRPNEVGYGAYEFSVIPVKGGVPSSLSVVNIETNDLILSEQLDSIPPGEMSSLVILGEDKNPPAVMETTSFSNYAVPLDAGIAVGFSHVIDTATATWDTLYIQDQNGLRLDAEIISSPNSPEQGASYILLIKPTALLSAGSKYTLVAENIGRPDGRVMTEPFYLVFRTGAPPGLVGTLDIPGAQSLKIMGQTALVSFATDGGGIGGANGFHTISLQNPSALSIQGTVHIDPGMLGRVRWVSGLNSDSLGPLAVLSHGSPSAIGGAKVRLYSLADVSSPSELGNVGVGISSEVMELCGEFIVTDTGDVWSGSVGDISVWDACEGRLRGVPKVVAIPTVIDTDGKQTVYFINQGIGIMTIDAARVFAGEDALGPSYLPADKAGGIVVRPDPLISHVNSQLSIDSPANLAFVEGSASIVGTVLDPRLDRVFVNGFSATIAEGGFSATVPLREGVNRVVATGYGVGVTPQPVAIDLIRPYRINPLRGPGTVQISIPAISTVVPTSISASVENKTKFDQIFINNNPAGEAKSCDSSIRDPSNMDCGWSGSGSTSLVLEGGSNTVYATAIDYDEYELAAPAYADLQLAEGLVLAVPIGGGLDIFDAASLIKMTSVSGVEGGFRVSVAQGVMTDIDEDGKTGLAENADHEVIAGPFDLDGDGEITVLDELKNLALIGHGASGTLTFVDITEPHKAVVLGAMQIPGGAYRAWADEESGIAYVAAGNAVVLVDLTRPAHVALDEDLNGRDDRILGSIDLGVGGAVDVRVDEELGLGYVLLKGKGLAVVELDQPCTRDVGVDVSRSPVRHVIRHATLAKEREDLLAAIHNGMQDPACGSLTLNGNAALLAQGSSACIWNPSGQCSTAYQPGISDYDFELIVPQPLLGAAAECGAAVQMVMQDPERLPNRSVFKDVSIFPVARDVFESAYRSVSPVNDTCGSGDDPYGDLCLGRNGLILKWLLEGEWVRSGGNAYDNGIDLEVTLDRLRSPLRPDDPETTENEDPLGILASAPQDYIEPSHVPRLEGVEWGCLEDFALNQSGARIRILGSGAGDVPVHDPLFHKKTHKAAKAGIRAVYGRLLSSNMGNALLLESTRREYASDQGCYTEVSIPGDPGGIEDFSYKRCESFEEYVASKALLSVVRNLPGPEPLGVPEPLWTEEEALFAYKLFRIKSDVGPGINDETEANAFIAKTMDFIARLRQSPEVVSIYEQTIGYFSDAEQRQANYTGCENDLQKFSPDKSGELLKIHVPARVFNDGYVNAINVPLQLYHDGVPVKNEFVTLSPGESIYRDRDSHGNYLYKIGHPIIGLDGQLHSVNLAADPANQITEYNKRNNLDGYYYYVLYEGNVIPPVPPGGSFIPPPPPGVTIPDPPSSALCLVDAEAPPAISLDLVSLVNGQEQANAVPGEIVELQWLIRNTGTEPLEALHVWNSLIGSLEYAGALDSGESDVIARTWTTPAEPDRYISVSTVQGTVGGHSLAAQTGSGVSSSYVVINVAEQEMGAKVTILSPPKVDDPENPFASQIFQTMAEGVIVSGVVETDQTSFSVEVNGVQAEVFGEAPLYEFRTRDPVRITSEALSREEILAAMERGEEPAHTLMVARVIGTNGQQMAEDEVKVSRLQPQSGLRVIVLVNGQKRVRVHPGDEVTVSLQAINDTDQEMEVSLLEFMGEDLESGFAPPEFTLAPGEEGPLLTFSYAAPSEVDSIGVIVHKAMAFGRSTVDAEVLVGPVSDSAEVWLGELILRPRLIFLPKDTSYVQLRTFLTANGEDVSSQSEGTTYHSLLPSDAITQTILEGIRLLLDDPTLLPERIPVAGLDIDPSGVLRASSRGLNVIWATHQNEKSDGMLPLESNYALVISGMELDSIALEPHSIITDSIALAQGVITSASGMLKSYLLGTSSPGISIDGNRNLPMILGMDSIDPCGMDLISQYSKWVSRTGYAELVGMRFKFADLDMTSVDLLAGARKILKLVPSPGIKVGNVAIKVPIGWFLGKVLNFSATQFVEFEIDNPGARTVATVSNAPLLTGIVTANDYGAARLTGTLSLSGYGSKSDGFVIVVPQVLSTDVRPDQNRLLVGQSTDLFSFAHIGVLQPSVEQEPILRIPIKYLTKHIPRFQDAMSDIEKVLYYAKKIIPGGIPGDMLLWEDRYLEVIEETKDGKASLRIGVALTLEEIQIKEIDIGLRTPNMYNEYEVDLPNVADFSLPWFWDDFSTVREVVGKAEGRALVKGQLCVPFLGSATDPPIGDSWFGAEVIVEPAGNEPPVAVADGSVSVPLVVIEDQPAKLDVLLNDWDEDGTLVPASVAIASGPANGIAVANPDGTVTYTPNPSFTGSDTFTYTVNDDDGATSNAAVVTLAVVADNEPPVAVADGSVSVPLVV
ncbi:MAG: Ig-like domain-containing protein, partial [Deferrisomatales bacterium]|nr:Ig-like domain-containing protein [Deferrisomatales bacterium]